MTTTTHEMFGVAPQPFRVDLKVPTVDDFATKIQELGHFAGYRIVPEYGSLMLVRDSFKRGDNAISRSKGLAFMVQGDSCLISTESSTRIFIQKANSSDALPLSEENYRLHDGDQINIEHSDVVLTLKKILNTFVIFSNIQFQS
jgi:hypothetical protein